MESESNAKISSANSAKTSSEPLDVQKMVSGMSTAFYKLKDG